VDYDSQSGRMVFVRDGKDIPPYVMAEVAQSVLPFPAMVQAKCRRRQPEEHLGRTAQSLITAPQAPDGQSRRLPIGRRISKLVQHGTVSGPAVRSR